MIASLVKSTGVTVMQDRIDQWDLHDFETLQSGFQYLVNILACQSLQVMLSRKNKWLLGIVGTAHPNKASIYVVSKVDQIKY